MLINHDVGGASTEHVRLLHALVELTTSPAQANRAPRVARQVLAALDASVAVILRQNKNGFETVALHQRDRQEMPTKLNRSQLEVLATRLAAKVVAERTSVRSSEPIVEQPSDSSLPDYLANYLGVPVFGLTGEVAGVAAVMGERERQFDEEDEWCLRAAAQLTATAWACETIESKLLQLELDLRPNATPGPSSDVAAGTAAVLSEDEISPPPPKIEKSTLSVLVVDDDRAINNILRRFITKQGYEVDSAFDGLEAVRMFQPDVHDVVISDIMMPHMNGWQLVEALRVTAPRVPVLLITGFSNTGTWNKEFLSKQGILALLNKPFDMNYIAKILKDLADTKCLISIS
ncbi:MAG: response regulator [Pyrinomonadaceae bacterium]|nr:response regulator [Pyrinomonadaceae bacterium]